MIELSNWNVAYPDGTQAVRDMSFQINDGEHVALIGANGAGKSSLILSMVGILPGQGTANMEGTPLQNADKEALRQVRSKVGIVFQNPDDQLFMPTIYDDIAFGPRNQGVDEETIAYRVQDRLDMLGIGHLRERTAQKLSGGEKRLVAMATVLAMKPDVMIFDEPTAFLDPKARRNLIRIIDSLPHTMLIATHDLAFAEETCSRCIVIKNGSVFAEGVTGDILRNAALMDAADLEALR